MVFFESSSYVGTEGERKRICLNITNEIARPADVSISVGPAQGYRHLSGAYFTHSFTHSLTHSILYGIV